MVNGDESIKQIAVQTNNAAVIPGLTRQLLFKKFLHQKN
jgi:hypothetical protein